ncbi:FAD-binding domain-containing protein [Xylariaceae sp. AK1471]|nr:FAD-binding domain-containing protein [Xylariaceae sp. AK1471]
MDASKAIDALAKVLPSGQLAIQGTQEYDQLNGSYQSIRSSETQPAAIFLPKSATEVSIFVRTISPFALSGQAPFAIFGAGQQPALGCNNIQGGITLNLSLLTGIDIKDDTVSIAAGERWGAVYEKLDPLGLSVAGGRSARNGIGGLALQGGLSFFSSREGFIADNVVNYQIVLASGEIVNANANDHPDLWKALRGGGNNFGVVTRFDLRTFKQGALYGGSLFYFAPSFPSEIQALVTELQKPNATPETHLMISIGFAAPFGPDPMCQNQVYYTQAVEKPEVLEPFTSVQPQIDALNTIRLIPNVTEAANEQAGDQQVAKRVAYMNATVKADIATLQAAVNIYTAAIDPVKATEGLICSLTFQPYAESLLQSSASKGGDVLGLEGTNSGSLVNLLLLTYWSNASDDGTILGAMKIALQGIDQDAASKGTKVDYVYMNYASEDQDVIGSYGSKNKKLLQEASKKYDPKGLFQKGVPGGWKLFT